MRRRNGGPAPALPHGRPKCQAQAIPKPIICAMLLAADPARAFMPYPPVEVPNAPGGPLAGLTFAAKDLFDVAGYPTSAGSPHVLALSGVKARTAPTVQALLDAGARLIGKTITDELAFS